MVDSPNAIMAQAPKRKRARSMRGLETERRVMSLAPFLPAQEIAQQLGISPQRVYQVMARYRRDNAEEFKSLPVEEWASEAVETYKQLISHGFQLLAKAEKIVNPKDKHSAQCRALDSIRQAREAHDRLLEKTGVFVGFNINATVDMTDILRSEKWLELQKLMMVFLQRKGIDPLEFLNFIEEERVSNKYKAPEAKMEPERSHEQEAKDLARMIEVERALDVDFEDLEEEENQSSK